MLLVEDEAALARGLVINLKLEGYDVDALATLAAARDALAGGACDLVVLDLNLPDGDGLELLVEAKRRGPRPSFLVLSARAADDERIVGLRLGADDYLGKPFRLEEFVLRVRNLLRRAAPGSLGGTALPDGVRIGAAELHAMRSLLIRGDERHLLTSLELALLVYLWKRRGAWVSREELLVEVWGYAPDTSTRTVDIFVSRLRRMLGDDATDPTLLYTKRGTGYMLADT